MSNQDPQERAAIDVRAIAEVATKAIYTHGFGFTEVAGPAERNGRFYVVFSVSDDTPPIRAAFWIDPEDRAALSKVESR